MTFTRFAAAAGLAAIALSACGKKEEAQPGAFPPEASAPAVGPLTAADWPTPSPGLWENKVVADASEGGATSRICYDEAVAKRMGVIGQQAAASMNCQHTLNRQVDGSLAFTATCDGMEGKRSTSKGVIRGDFTKGYTIEFTDADDPAGTPPARMSATRLGDCPADFKPGDMEVGGVRVNVGG